MYVCAWPAGVNVLLAVGCAQVLNTRPLGKGATSSVYLVADLTARAEGKPDALYAMKVMKKSLVKYEAAAGGGDGAGTSVVTVAGLVVQERERSPRRPVPAEWCEARNCGAEEAAAPQHYAAVRSHR